MSIEMMVMLTLFLKPFDEHDVRRQWYKCGVDLGSRRDFTQRVPLSSGARMTRCQLHSSLCLKRSISIGNNHTELCSIEGWSG